MHNQPLHPDLARLDAAYDEITARYARGELAAADANAAIVALAARDDEGTLWHKDPATGGWLRRTHTGELVAGTPPAYGVATPTPYDLAVGARPGNPDHRITFHPVDEDSLYPQDSLRGSTRRAGPADEGGGIGDWVDRWLGTGTRKMIAILVALVLVFVIVSALRSGGDTSEPPPLPTTPTQPAPAPPPAS